MNKNEKIMNIAVTKDAPFDTAAIAATLHTMMHNPECIRFWVFPDALDAFKSVKVAHEHEVLDIADAALLFDALPECFDSFMEPSSELVAAIEAARNEKLLER